MRKIIVFQHAAHEILGTLNPLLKERGFRVRYVNFSRHPALVPTLDRYNGLIVLGGNMGVYEAELYPHIRVELKLIEQALQKNIPVLGICLGAQLLAEVLGAKVRKSAVGEIGWHDVQVTDAGTEDPVFGSFQKSEKVFQFHGDTFDPPAKTVHLARSELCPAQAFRLGDKVYGMQFHLEVDQAMILRWLKADCNQASLADTDVAKIKFDTEKYVARSLELSRATFAKFIDCFGEIERQELVGSGHGKPRRAGD